MKVIDIQNKDIWENFFLDYKDKTFLQSWNWGEFNLEMGNKIWRLGILNEEKLIGLALISKIKAKRGTFLLMQHGPTIHPLFKKEALSFLLKKLKVIGKTGRTTNFPELKKPATHKEKRFTIRHII